MLSEKYDLTMNQMTWLTETERTSSSCPSDILWNGIKREWVDIQVDQYADVQRPVTADTVDTADSGLLPFNIQCSVNFDASHNPSTTSEAVSDSTPQSNDHAMGYHPYKRIINPKTWHIPTTTRHWTYRLLPILRNRLQILQTSVERVMQLIGVTLDHTPTLELMAEMEHFTTDNQCIQSPLNLPVGHYCLLTAGPQNGANETNYAIDGLPIDHLSSFQDPDQPSTTTQPQSCNTGEELSQQEDDNIGGGGTDLSMELDIV
jgi:hypothetical protein